MRRSLGKIGRDVQSLPDIGCVNRSRRVDAESDDNDAAPM
jgi:hypothetical protein